MDKDTAVRLTLSNLPAGSTMVEYMEQAIEYEELQDQLSGFLFMRSESDVVEGELVSADLDAGILEIELADPDAEQDERETVDLPDGRKSRLGVAIAERVSRQHMGDIVRAYVLPESDEVSAALAFHVDAKTAQEMCGKMIWIETV